MKEKPKLYVIRKYVMARSVVEAARKEKATPAHSIFIEENWQNKNLAETVGFSSSPKEA